ncbi:MAG: WecB/TagA/CpsF family glycosyltransferase [Hyphomicrobiales bacterium]|nr:WecB/TagA/CpsF family glycosyltransferase [Hyphomicrobiales bacterium]
MSLESAEEAAGQEVIRLSVLGVRVDAARSLDSILAALETGLQAGAGMLITFVNPSSVSFAEKDPVYRDLLASFDLVLPDGQGMVKAIRLLHRREAVRASFDSTSLAIPVLRDSEAKGRSVCLVGGRPGVGEAAAAQLKAAFPALVISLVLDGYGDKAGMIARVRQDDPDIVIAAMGWKNQESFLLELRISGWRGVGFTCGGYLDQLANGLQYYPERFDKLNLRWLYRLYKEPTRLWRRYFFDYGLFAIRLASSLANRGRKVP